MVLLAESFDTVKAMSKAERTQYFETHALYFEDAPGKPYAIQVGSRFLFSNDTADLRIQFDKLLRYGPKWGKKTS